MYREKIDLNFGNISRKGQTDMANSDTLRMTKLGGGVVRVHTHSLWKKEKLPLDQPLKVGMQALQSLPSRETGQRQC